MGSALARAACPSVGPENVYLANRTLAKAQALGDALGCHVAQNNGHALAHAQYVFLCVKPHLLSGVLAELASDLEGCAARGEEKVLISDAVTFDSRLHPACDLENARKVAAELGGIHVVVTVDELSMEEIRSNPVDRCYLCRPRK